MASQSSQSSSLRDHLKTSLSSLPNSTTLQIFTLISQPRRIRDLFPHLLHHPKCYQTDYLILLGSSAPAEPSHSTIAATDLMGVEGEEPQVVLTSALSAHLYTFPPPYSSSSSSTPSTSSALLYISKVDSSTHGPVAPLTRELITSFLLYHILPSTRPAPEVRIQLFARSQGQYLFPNSADGGKKQIGGLRLCGWWKNVFEEVSRRFMDSCHAQESQSESTARSNTVPSNNKGDDSATKTNGSKLVAEGDLNITMSRDSLRLEYILPSYSSTEAFGMLGPPKKPLPPSIAWNYTPPFPTRITGLDPTTESSRISLGSLIPSLPDDPKTRFLDELVDSDPFHMSNSSSSKPTTKSTSTHTDESQQHNSDTHSDPVTLALNSPRKKRKTKDTQHEEEERAHSEKVLSQTSKEEFWERMGFRQEMAIDITGFFGLTSIYRGGKGSTSETNTQQFSMEDVGKEEIVKSQLAAADSTVFSSGGEKGRLSHHLVDRLQTALLNTDFKTFDLALEGSQHWIKTARTMIIDEIGKEGWDLNVGVIPRKEGLEGQNVVGEKRKEKEEIVTVLQVRKKKKA